MLLQVRLGQRIAHDNRRQVDERHVPFFLSSPPAAAMPSAEPCDGVGCFSTLAKQGPLLISRLMTFASAYSSLCVLSLLTPLMAWTRSFWRGWMQICNWPSSASVHSPSLAPASPSQALLWLATITITAPRYLRWIVVRVLNREIRPTRRFLNRSADFHRVLHWVVTKIRWNRTMYMTKQYNPMRARVVLVVSLFV